MSPLKWKTIAVTVAAGALALAGAMPAVAATAAPADQGMCGSGDSALAYEEVGNGASYVAGDLCWDHTNGGWYWAVEVTDISSDGKCAHAAADWLHKNGNHYDDYGMYVCGLWNYADFRTPTRNPTLYQWTRLGAFVDNGPVTWGQAVATS
ncbi:hypothetical protein ACYF6T_18980 [Streptomyces sp. 7R007]